MANDVKFTGWSERAARAPGLLACVLLCGCLSDPSSNVGFDEPDPQARIRAARLAAEGDDRAAIPELIRMLGSDDPAERLTAIGSLEHLTGQTLGYRHYDLEPIRAEAIDRWVDWLAGQHASEEPVPSDP